MGCFVMVMVVATAMVTCTAGDLIKVGGQKGWTQDVNYTQWASNRSFHVGDWLYFVFDKHHYSVLEVNATSYEQCNEHDFIQNITRGGRDVFNLTQPRPYYFISGGGYCFQGMKLSILIERPVLPPTPSSSVKSSSHRRTTDLVVLLMCALLLTLFVKSA